MLPNSMSYDKNADYMRGKGSSSGVFCFPNVSTIYGNSSASITSIHPRRNVVVADASNSVLVHDETTRSKQQKRPPQETGAPRQACKKKHVTFDPHAAQVLDIPVVLNNPKRLHELWWTRREIESIRALERRRHARWEEQQQQSSTTTSEEDEDEEFFNEYIEQGTATTTSHGLYTFIIREERRVSRKVVLQEWERQEQLGLNLPGYIATAYLKYTRTSKREAHRRGAKLAKEVRQQEEEQEEQQDQERSSSFLSSSKQRWTSTVAAIPIKKEKRGSRTILSSRHSRSPPRFPIRKEGYSIISY